MGITSPISDEDYKDKKTKEFLPTTKKRTPTPTALNFLSFRFLSYIVMKKLSLKLPSGYRFSPTEQEIIELFLKSKITGNDKEINHVPEIEFYDHEPWDLQRNLLIYIITHPPLFLGYFILCCQT